MPLVTIATDPRCPSPDSSPKKEEGESFKVGLWGSPWRRAAGWPLGRGGGPRSLSGSFPSRNSSGFALSGLFPGNKAAHFTIVNKAVLTAPTSSIGTSRQAEDTISSIWPVTRNKQPGCDDRQLSMFHKFYRINRFLFKNKFLPFIFVQL